ncbi:SDR family oxidoreductase [Azospirillum doebereinerae]
MNVLANSVAWITGGGSGIGAAGAKALALAGATVVVSGRRREELDRVAGAIREAGGRAEAAVLDVTDEAAVRRTAAAILEAHGRIDTLVASAGLNLPNRSFEALGPGDWARLVDVNLNGAMHAIQAVLPAMRERRTGTVIIISSWVGRHAVRLGGPGYNATKQALVALSHSLNMEECGNGLRSCVIMPGEVETGFLTQRAAPPPPEELARLLRPDDLGRTIRFVAEMPPHVCVNEILISPTWNRNFLPPASSTADAAPEAD